MTYSNFVFFLLLSFLMPYRMGAQQTNDNQKPIAADQQTLTALQLDAGAIRDFRLNAKREVVQVSISRHLSSDQIALIQQLKSLREVTVAGPPRGGCCTAPREELILAEANRTKNMPLALPQLANQPIRSLLMLEQPTQEEMEVIASWRQLKRFSAPLATKQYARLKEHDQLETLALRDTIDQQIVAADFLTNMNQLKSLSLSRNFDDSVLIPLAGKSKLVKIESSNLSGEALFEYFSAQRGFGLYQSLRKAGYSVSKDNDGRVTELWIRSGDITRLYSEKVLDQLVDLKSVRLSHIHNAEQKILYLLKNKPIETLELVNCNFSSDQLTELFSIPTLKELAYSSGSKEKLIDEVSNLPALARLSLGGINQNRTQLDAIRNLPKLEVLNLYRASIDGDLARQFKELPSLKQLNLRGCHLTTNAILAISTIAHLEKLDFSETNLDEIGLKALSRIANLENLNAAGANVSLNALSRFYRKRLNYRVPQLLNQFDAKFLNAQNRIVQPAKASKIRFGDHFCDEFWAATLEYPNITHLKFVMTEFAPNSFQAIEDQSSISDIEIIHSENLDLETLRRIGQLPGLKRLSIAHCDLLERDCVNVLAEFKQLEKLELDLNCLDADDFAELQRALPGTQIMR